MNTQETYSYMPSEDLIRMAINSGSALEVELARRLDDYRKAVEKVCAQEPPGKVSMFLRAQAI